METNRSNSFSMILQTKSERMLGRRWDCPSAQDFIPDLRSRTWIFKNAMFQRWEPCEWIRATPCPLPEISGVTYRYRWHRYSVTIKKQRSPVVRQHEPVFLRISKYLNTNDMSHALNVINILKGPVVASPIRSVASHSYRPGRSYPGYDGRAMTEAVVATYD